MHLISFFENSYLLNFYIIQEHVGRKFSNSFDLLVIPKADHRVICNYSYTTSLLLLSLEAKNHQLTISISTQSNNIHDLCVE